MGITLRGRFVLTSSQLFSSRCKLMSGSNDATMAAGIRGNYR